MPHEDGGAYHPIVATISLAGSVVMDVTEKPAGDDTEDSGKECRSWRILQEPRSLLVTTGAAYTDTLHGIAETTLDEHLSAENVANWDLLGDRDVLISSAGTNERNTRISLTYRDVKKVSQVGSKVFGRART